MGKKFWSRKYHLALVTLVIVTLMLQLGKIGDSIYRDIIIANLMYYGIANVKSKPEDKTIQG